MSSAASFDRPLHFIGMLRSFASWAKVTRELLSALIGLGQPVEVTEYAEDRYDPSFPLSPVLEAAIGKRSAAPVYLTYLPPNEYPKALHGRPRVGFLDNESTRWPSIWVSVAERHLDRAVVSSASTWKTLSDSGFPQERISIVPPGHDPAIFHAGRRETPGGHDLLRILFVGVPSFRKGLDIMLRAFEAAFRPGEPVELVLKLAHYPDEQSRPYLYREWRTHAAALADRGYRIRAITHFYSEEEMAELYRSVDLICQPFRGEAFCIPLLEAMACGTPVIATAWGGPLDFVDERAGLLISDYKLIPEAALFTWSNDPHPEALLAQPDLEAVVAALRQVASDRALLARLGEGAKLLAQRFTWEDSARRFVAEMIRGGLARPAKG